MANSFTSDSLKSLCECPVCFEAYKEPRLLSCGHQFCQKCLIDIARFEPQGAIPCPSCRTVTTPTRGDVTTLPRSTLHQYMQDLIFSPSQGGDTGCAGLQSQGAEATCIGQQCSKCKLGKPTYHCTECTADLSYLCDKCYGIHQTIDRYVRHVTIPFDPLLICRNHPHKMVERYCYACYDVACIDCLFDKHNGHSTESLRTAAEQSRSRVKAFLVENQRSGIDRSVVSELDDAAERLQNIKSEYKAKADTMRRAMRHWEERLDAAVEKTADRIDDEIDQLARHKRKINEALAAQDHVTQLAESMLGDDVAAPELISGVRGLIPTDLDIGDLKVDVPVIQLSDASFDKMVDDIRAFSMVVNYEEEVYAVKSVSSTGNETPAFVRDINTEHPVCGIVFDTGDGTLVTVDRDAEGQVKVYRDGALVRQVGTDMLSARSIAIDTRRDLYLLPCEDGRLVRMEADGMVRDAGSLGTDLASVGYIHSEDVYVVAEYTGRMYEPAGSVFTVSPDSMTIMRYVDDRDAFSTPWHLCTGDVDGRTVIAVRDWNKSAICLYSSDGERLWRCGPEAGTLGSLCFPGDVAIDGGGRLVVCDTGDSRVLRVRSDTDGDHWECLLDHDTLGEDPWDVTIDKDTQQMAVRVDNTIKLFSY